MMPKTTIGHILAAIVQRSGDMALSSRMLMSMVPNAYRDKRVSLRFNADAETVGQRLYDTEMRNLDHYGYGIKSFGLSMIETAIKLTGGRIQARDIQAIIDRVKLLMP